MINYFKMQLICKDDGVLAGVELAKIICEGIAIETKKPIVKLFSLRQKLSLYVNYQSENEPPQGSRWLPVDTTWWYENNRHEKSVFGFDKLGTESIELSL